MKTEDVGKLPPMGRFIYWIRERHDIYLRRQAGQEKPWTDDEVLQSFFFTNPYRENDKVTVWFRESVREPLHDDPAVVFATIAFRWFNYIPTGEALIHYGISSPCGLLENWNKGAAVKLLSAIRATGMSTFTGAYMIPAPGGSKKIEHVCDCLETIWQDRESLKLLVGASLEEAHAMLVQYPWLGKFMAYEVVTDLRHTYVLENAPDIMTWANPGPGAIRGLRRLAGEPLGKGNSDSLPRPKDWQERMIALLETANDKLRPMTFEMRDIEHALCEVDKYCRALTQDGKMKRRYDGRAS